MQRKRRRFRFLSFTPLLLLLAAFACNKPAHIGKSVEPEEITPIAFSTSLADTLPAKTLEELNVTDATGIKIVYIDGHYVSYFDYLAEPHKVISAISNLAFSKRSVVADTTCRRISYKSWELLKEQVPASEMDNSEFFWRSYDDGVEAFECIKPPFKHTFIIGKNSTQIFHRIEFLG